MGNITDRFAGHPKSNDRPEQIEEVLAKIVLDHVRFRGRLPSFIPDNEYAVASWWQDMQEKPTSLDKPHKVSVPGKDEYRWESPYVRRLSYTLSKFLSLNENDQRLIIAAKEEDVYWRGDDIDFFMNLVSETQRMRKIGIQKYREECIAKMKKFVGKVQDQEAINERRAIQEEFA